MPTHSPLPQTKENQFPRCCGKDGKANCEYMIWTSIDSPTYCTKKSSEPLTQDTTISGRCITDKQIDDLETLCTNDYGETKGEGLFDEIRSSPPYRNTCGLSDGDCNYRDSELEKGHRQDEREKVLDELREDLKTRFIPSSNQWSKGRNSGLIECCNIIDESLRKKDGEA